MLISFHSVQTKLQTMGLNNPYSFSTDGSNKLQNSSRNLTTITDTMINFHFVISSRDLKWVFYPKPFLLTGIVVACICLSVRVSVHQSFACLHGNSRTIRARIKRFGSIGAEYLVKKPRVFGAD